MGATSRRNSPGLKRLLDEEGYRFEFFQAVRLLQRERLEDAPVGTGDDPARESIRFASQVSMAFAPSDVTRITLGEEDGDPAEMSISFLGAASPASYGSLPLPYAELVMGLERDKNPVLRQFLDLFNHRIISLFYRAWEKYRYALTYERDSRRGPGVFERAVFALMGMGTEAQRGRMACDDRALLARAYAVRGRAVSAQGLAELVRSYFRVPITVRQFVSCWYPIEKSERCQLGVNSCRLGQDISLGSRVHLAQSRFRLRLGPMDWDRFRDFLPTGQAFRPLVEMTGLAAGPEFDFDCQLVLNADSAPGIRLGPSDGSAAGQDGAQLGWSTWLHTEPLAENPADVIIDGELVGA
jgi:type VI secretion system protein ImpH